MWPNPQEILDLVAFAEEILNDLNGKLNFLCSYNKRTKKKEAYVWPYQKSMELFIKNSW